MEQAFTRRQLLGASLGAAVALGRGEEPAELILRGGKVVTVDPAFSIAQAVAVRGGKIAAVGGDAEVMKLCGRSTTVVNLRGKTLIPGLIDSHTHPGGASMTEFDHAIPTMESISDVLAYVRSRAKASKPGDWIELSQVFITRLKEQRYPTRRELDEAAPRNPVLFATGPDASLNSLALKLSGIDRDFKPTDGGAGFVERDASGEPTGILRNLTRYVKVQPTGRRPTAADREHRLRELFRDYNATGITSIGDRDAHPEELDRYAAMRAAGDLTVRISASHHVDTNGPIEQIREAIRRVAAHPLRKPDPLLQIIGIKTFLDGGMLTGSAYMRESWGVSKIYSITDPNYRGVLFIPSDRLLKIVDIAVRAELQFTAHSVGDGAVHALLKAYEDLLELYKVEVRPEQAESVKRWYKLTRPCITHSNFMSAEAVKMAARLGVCLDIQPAWLYLDTHTLVKQFGYERLRWFQPLKSIFEAGVIAGGGSDHMQKIGSLRSINFYNPFLAMWTAIARRAKGYEGQLHPEEAITREQALRFYTANNAYLMFREKEVGSIEPGKQADLAVLDRDPLTCPLDALPKTKVLETYLSGSRVH